MSSKSKFEVVYCHLIGKYLIAEDMEVQDDDDVRLPEDTQLILNQFLLEKAKQEKEELSENWNLSQFW